MNKIQYAHIIFVLFIFQKLLVAVPAGVLPYAQFQNRWVILLGMDVHRQGYWIDFGGQSDRRETVIETAAREFCEETMYCFFENTSEVKKRLKYRAPIISADGYQMYPLRVPFIQDLNKMLHALCAKHHIKGIPGSGHCWLLAHHIEKIDYAWIWADDLKMVFKIAQGHPSHVILKSVDGRTIKLHFLLVQTLATAAGQHFLQEL